MASEILGKFSICPVCTGMNLMVARAAFRNCYLPRMHGDEPILDMPILELHLSAPYARG